MKILVFGTGKFYINRRQSIKEYGDEIVGFIDNKATDIVAFEGREVFLPSNIKNLSYDAILLMSTDYRSMRHQLLKLGEKIEKIYDWNRYNCEKQRGIIKLYPNLKNDNLSKKNVLIISDILNYNGATLAISHATVALMKLGYNVTLSAAGANDKFLNEMIDHNIQVILVPCIPYIGNAELDWMRQYDIIVVNVFQMIRIAYVVSKYKPLLWWVHEPSERFEEIYRDTIACFPYENRNIINRRIYICAVSNLAKMNFEKYHPNMVNAILPYGISDESKSGLKKGNDIVFAIIGPVVERKGQIYFLKAISMLDEKIKNKSKFLIIGSERIGTDYYKKVASESANIPHLIFTGELTRKKMKEIFTDIDVVVCASLEETMSLTITEGMMHGKVCITTDATGMADYIVEGENGFVCSAGDYMDLSKKMKYVIENYDSMENVRRKARATYEKIFSLESFAQRLEKELSNCEKSYYKETIE